MMKKQKVYINTVTSALLIISILMQLTIPLVSMANDSSISIEMTSEATELKEGSTIVINLYITGDKISSFSGYLHYDENVFDTPKRTNFVIPDALLDDGNGYWSVSYTSANKKMYIAESDGDYYTIPDGLLLQIKLNVIKDEKLSKITISGIEADGKTDYYYEEVVECTVPKPTYEVTYNQNTTDTITGMPSDEIKTEKIDYTIVDNIPVREGYTFKGWNTESDGSGTNYVAGNKYSTDDNLTLYAQWERNKTTLTVNPNGGVWEGRSDSQTFTQEIGTTKTINNPTTTPSGNRITYNANGGTISKIGETQTTLFNGWTGATLSGTTYTFTDNNQELIANYVGNNVELPTATKEGTIFLGWYQGENRVGGEGDNYAPKYTTPNAQITLTARYQEAAYTLTINPNGGMYNGSAEISTIQGEYNSTTTISNPIKEGYTVKLENNGGTTSLTQTYTFNGWTSTAGTIDGQTYTFAASDATLTANYTVNPITLPIPTTTGYNFIGWNTSSDGNGTNYNGEDLYTPESNMTLYAQCTPNTYIITFDFGENVQENPATTTVTYDSPYGELPTPTKEGYTFVGWYDDNGNKIENTSIVNIEDNATIYAKYEINKYTIIFEDEDGTEIKRMEIEYNSDAIFRENMPTKNVEPGYQAKFIGWENEEALSNVKQNATVRAKYNISPIVYEIKYNNLKNSDNSQNPTKYTIEDVNFTLSDLPSQEKFIFDGWYMSNDKNAEKITSIDTSKLGNIELYARWESDELYLSSEKYKIGENDIDNYEDGDIYLDKIEPNTTVEELIANCYTNGTITVIDKDGKALYKDDLVGTEMTIEVTRYDEKITLIAVVMGDLSGDGKVTATDLSALNQTIIYQRTLEGAVFKAADLDDNKRLTATDLSTINQSILKTINLTYNKKNIL